jgi:antitoxin component of MazEF toxin-antitoxin module
MKYIRQAINIGNSVAVVIPKDLAIFLKINPGDSLAIQDDKGKHGDFLSIWKKENE